MVFALVAHASANNVRKYTGEEYIVHPVAVVQILRTYGVHDEATIAAAYLHDTIEDAGITREQIAESFGEEVASIVMELTMPAKPEDGNRQARFLKNLEHLAKAGPKAQTIKLADILDNCRSIVTHDPKFAKVYLPEKLMQMGLLRQGNPGLYQKVARWLSVEAARLGVE